MWVEERQGFYRIEVPLPGNPLKSLNSYLVKGGARNLLIDNGFNMEESYAALLQALNEIGVKADSLDFFITHLHADHNGLTGRLAAPDAKIYCGQADGKTINAAITEPAVWRRLLFTLASHGFPENDLEEVYDTHPGRIYANPEPLAFTWAREGDIFEYGKYRLRAIAVPGHTPGQIALLEDAQRFFISGDHILGKITPNITYWDGVQDSLGDYLHSLQKVEKLRPAVTYPGHRAIVPDTLARIRELYAHHERRLGEAYALVNKKERANAWNVASEMTWSLRGTWPEYRVAQKIFATGEAVAHLDHLVATGKLAREIEGGHIYYLKK